MWGLVTNANCFFPDMFCFLRCFLPGVGTPIEKDGVACQEFWKKKKKKSPKKYQDPVL